MTDQERDDRVLPIRAVPYVGADHGTGRVEGPGPWGVYDTRDDCWMGNGDGPAVHTDPGLAALAAAVCNGRFDVVGRFRARTLGVNRPGHLKDALLPPISALEAIGRLEREAPGPCTEPL